MAEKGKTAEAAGMDEGRLRQIIREELAALLHEELPAAVHAQLAQIVPAPAGVAAVGGGAISPGAPPNTTGRLNHRTMALIAAAVAAALGSQARVRNITFLNQNTISGWVEAGRINIQSSHILRRSL